MNVGFNLKTVTAMIETQISFLFQHLLVRPCSKSYRCQLVHPFSAAPVVGNSRMKNIAEFYMLALVYCLLFLGPSLEALDCGLVDVSVWRQHDICIVSDASVISDSIHYSGSSLPSTIYYSLRATGKCCSKSQKGCGYFETMRRRLYLFGRLVPCASHANCI